VESLDPCFVCLAAFEEIRDLRGLIPWGWGMIERVVSC
jgi:hypothetical protein